MKFLVAGILISIAGVPAPACSVLSMTATRNASDVIVWGVGSFDFNNRTGTIRARHVQKGRRQRTYSIRWQPLSSDDMECGAWFPLDDNERGRFFLVRDTDRTFYVISHDQRPRIDK